MIRHELNIETGESVEIQQTAYKNAQGELLILDAADEAPAGYQAISDAEALGISKASSMPELRSQAVKKVRSMQATVFATLGGIQSQAIASGDMATAQAICPIQEALKGLPHIDLSACESQADIDSAFINAWAEIKALAPPNVASAFNGVLA